MKKTIHIPAAATALILSLAAGSLAHAQSGPSLQEQMACRSDAGKMCSEHIGKPPQMNAWMAVARWWNRAAGERLIRKTPLPV